MVRTLHIGILLGAYDHNQEAIVSGVRSYIDEQALPWQIVVPHPAMPNFNPFDTLKPLDGAIGWSQMNLYGAVFRQLEYTRRPQVVLHGSERRDTSSPHQATIGTDDRAIGRLAADHAHAVGYRRAAAIFSNPDGHGFPRLSAYLQRCQELGMTITAWRRENDGAVHREDQASWLHAQADPTALFCHQDRVAEYWRRALPDLGLAIPARWGLLGVDNSPRVCTGTNPTLTSVDLPYRHIGRLAAQALHQLLSGARPEPVTIPPLRVIARESTRLPATPLVERARRHMQRTIHRPMAIKALASKLGVHNNTLLRAFTADLGTTPKEYQIRLRLEHAGELLLTTDHNLREIARACGFAHHTTFVTAFGKHFGVPPGRFRAMGRR